MGFSNIVYANRTFVFDNQIALPDTQAPSLAGSPIPDGWDRIGAVLTISKMVITAAATGGGDATMVVRLWNDTGPVFGVDLATFIVDDVEFAQQAQVAIARSWQFNVDQVKRLQIEGRANQAVALELTFAVTLEYTLIGGEL